MVRVEYVHKILRELSRILWVAIRNVRYEVDQVSNRYNAVVSRGGRCLQEYLPLVLVLAMLIQEVLFVRTIAASASDIACAWNRAYVGSRLILYCRFELRERVSRAACA